MYKRNLGSSLSVSAIGYGCMGLSHAYGYAVEKEDAIRRIHEAVDIGYTFFDTAEVYVGKYADGSPSINEEIVGEALRSLRHKVSIASKGGIGLDTDLKITPRSQPRELRKSLEQSLKRLGVETIDLYYQHRMDPAVEPEVVAEAMRGFIREGKIRFWGISNASEEYIRRAHAVCPVACVQLRYSMMARWNEKLFPVLEELDIGFVAYSPLANGFLTSAAKGDPTFGGSMDYRSKMPQYSQEGREKARPLLELIETLATEKHASPAQISLAWVLAQKPYIVPIPGSSKAERIRENAEAVTITFTQEELKKIDTLLGVLSVPIFGEQEKNGF